LDARAARRREVRMPRYVVERTFQDGWHIPADREGAELCLAIGERNADEGSPGSTHT